MERFETFTRSIFKLNRFIQKIKAKKMKEYGLKGTTSVCLYYLSVRKNLSARDLVILCEEDKAAISRALQSLEEKKYIKYDGDMNKKKYNTTILLTDEGKNVAEDINNKVMDALSVGGSGLTEENRKIFYDSLIKITNNLEDYIFEGEEKDVIY